jgi:hypothetical protein
MRWIDIEPSLRARGSRQLSRRHSDRGIAVAEYRAIKRKPARSGVISNIYRISSLTLISMLESGP